MGFDDLAKRWDTESRIERARIIAEAIGKELNKETYAEAMEFGCGTGLISFNLLDRFDKITMMDSSKGMIEILDEKIKSVGDAKLVSQWIDIEGKDDPEESNERYDVIYNSLVLHHIDDISAISEKFFKLLNNEGELCIVDLDEEDGSFHKRHSDFDGHNGFDQERLSDQLRAVGFNQVKSETFYKGEKRVDGQVINYSLFILRAKKVCQ